jgi:hypothetical protein
MNFNENFKITMSPADLQAVAFAYLLNFRAAGFSFKVVEMI